MNSKRYEGKVCLITGGTSGIGYEIAKRMAIESGKVLVCSVDDDIQGAVQALSEDGKYKVEGMRCDVTKPLDRQNVL